VLVAHATGGKPIPEHLVKLATEPYKKRKNKWAIVIPAYKAAPFIMECLNSLPKGDDVRVLIGLDNCKSTLKAIKKVKGLNMEVYMFPKVGPYVIRNTLAELAEDCDNILFFDADDWLMPDGFDKIRASNTTVTRFPFVMVKDGEVVPPNIPYAHGCFAIDRECFLIAKGFKPWPVGADSEFMFRTEHEGIDSEVLNKPVFFRRKHKNSLTVHPDTGEGSNTRRFYMRMCKTFVSPEHLHVWRHPSLVKTKNV
jgi:glycosyltransferase involved in cell wall biosynthesis